MSSFPSNTTHETKQTMSTEYTPSASVAAQIDAMVAAAGARVEHSQQLASANGTQGAVKIGYDGTAQILGEVREAERIHDDRRDLNVERANDQKRVDELQAKLDAHTFDSRTGEKIMVAQGYIREMLELQLLDAKTNVVYSEQQYQRIEAQRERDAAWKAAADEEELMYLQVTGGDPLKRARLQELLGDEELKTAAQVILAARYERCRR
jgi:hypothetical protein